MAKCSKLGQKFILILKHQKVHIGYSGCKGSCLQITTLYYTKIYFNLLLSEYGSPLCKQEAAEDIWKIDEQPDVSDISFDVTVVNKTILQLSDVQLLLSSHLQFQSCSLRE